MNENQQMEIYSYLEDIKALLHRLLEVTEGDEHDCGICVETKDVKIQHKLTPLKKK